MNIAPACFDPKIIFWKLHCSLLKQQLSEKQNNKNPSGIYKLKCNTCNKAYVGQSGRSIDIRHKEHIRYIRTNNPQSAYAMYILQNRQEYGTAEDTLQLLKSCRKSTPMNCWETLYMQIFNQHKILITEQQTGDINPLYEFANTTNIPPPTQPITSLSLLSIRRTASHCSTTHSYTKW